MKKVYCHKCHKKVDPKFHKGGNGELPICPECKRPLWEAGAEHNDNKLRTTKSSYRDVVEKRADEKNRIPPQL